MPKIKFFVRLGQLSFCILVLLCLLGSFISPFEVESATTGPLRLQSGLSFKYSDEILTTRFVRSLRGHGGVLCLGTSETTSLPEGNWTDFLNADYGRAAVLAGAGRTAGVHLPWMHSVSEELEELDVVYFINPVYWNEQLGQMDPEYWMRYTTASLLQEASSELPFLDEVLRELPINERWNLASSIREVRSSWFQDLRWHLMPNEFEKSFSPLRTWTGQVPKAPDSRIDLDKGKLRSFQNDDWFSRPSLPEETTFRDAELIAFIEASHNWKVNLTIVLGPMNIPFIRYHDPGAEPAVDQQLLNLVNLLDSSDVNWIDATNLGEIPGFFNDHQHISSFGASLIAQRVRESLELPKLQP